MLSKSEAKLLTYEAAKALSGVLRSAAFKVVITNGCFDVIHVGHVRFLEESRNLGDILIVGVNTDAAVRALKGDRRPINPLRHRVEVLAALSSTSYVLPLDCIRVHNFITDMQAKYWAKGGDYTLDTLNQSEVASAMEVGTEIKILTVVSGVSTTGILSRHEQRNS